MAPSSASWARQSPHHVAQKLSITTSPRYSDKRRFLPEKLLSTKSGAAAPLSSVAAVTVPVAASNPMSAAPLHSALIRSPMQKSSRTSSERRRKPYSDAALRVYEPGLSPLAQGFCGIQSTERATSHKRAETRAVARFRIMGPADETRELSARGYSRAACETRKAAKRA